MRHAPICLWARAVCQATPVRCQCLRVTCQADTVDSLSSPPWLALGVAMRQSRAPDGQAHEAIDPCRSGRGPGRARNVPTGVRRGLGRFAQKRSPLGRRSGDAGGPSPPYAGSLTLAEKPRTRGGGRRSPPATIRPLLHAVFKTRARGRSYMEAAEQALRPPATTGHGDDAPARGRGQRPHPGPAERITRSRTP
jgi:hypothetical protein